jgi:hypothetical protein
MTRATWIQLLRRLGDSAATLRMRLRRRDGHPRCSYPSLTRGAWPAPRATGRECISVMSYVGSVCCAPPGPANHLNNQHDEQDRSDSSGRVKLRRKQTSVRGRTYRHALGELSCARTRRVARLFGACSLMHACRQSPSFDSVVGSEWWRLISSGGSQRAAIGRCELRGASR